VLLNHPFGSEIVMASDHPTGDWRHQRGSKQPIPSGKTSHRAWHPSGQLSPPHTNQKRYRWRNPLIAGGVTVALLVLVGVLIWWFWPPRYPVLAIAGGNTGGSLAIPENAAGVHLANELAEWAASGGQRPKWISTPTLTSDESGATIHLETEPKNLVVYLTAPGGADGQGAYLLVADPKAASTAQVHKLRLSHILSRIKERRSGKRTLLVLDPTTLTTSWAHGLLFNDFARALKELDDEIRSIPGLAVICSSDVDQRSWLFEEKQTTVFGYYFLEILRGEGHSPGSRITAASAFERLKPLVENWAIAHRWEKQTPILLPLEAGLERAQMIDLAAAPTAGYKTPATTDGRRTDLDSLRQAWIEADRLRAINPPPEATNPVLWREYLERLLQWERLARLGADTEAIRTQVSHLVEQLQQPTRRVSLTCLSVATPAATALGQAPPPAIVKTRQIIEQLLTDSEGVTLKQLETADQELKLLYEQSGPPPVEAHFVRMLHRFLGTDGRPVPSPRLLRKAIEVRLLAENAAWRFGAKDQYPYAEFVFSWVGHHVEAGDQARQLGQDLLFSHSPDDWSAADKFFDTASTHYQLALSDGQRVAKALAIRDQVLVQLPYYARWLANHRGDGSDSNTTAIAQAITHAEKAARGVRELGQLLLRPGARFDTVQAAQTAVAADFQAVTATTASELSRLLSSNSVNPSDWHALDNALTIPFIPATERMQLLSRLQHISQQLEANRQQLSVGEARVLPPAIRQQSSHHRRLACAILGLPQPVEVTGNDWPRVYREAGEQIAEAIRKLSSTTLNDLINQARSIPSLSVVGEHLAQGAWMTRFIDPASPQIRGVDFIAIDQAYRRHELLLWQARRVTTEGWADLTSTALRPDWYCQKISGSLIQSAGMLIQHVAENVNQSSTLRLEELKPWLAAQMQELERQPVELLITAEQQKVVVDEKTIDFPFSISVPNRPGEIGFPLSWVEPPAEVVAQPKPELIQPRIERSLQTGQAVVTRHVRFDLPGKPTAKQLAGRLVSRVLYRGQVYEKPTQFTRVELPSREWVYHPPPQGKDDKAAFAIQADESDVAGTVTILIDLTNSMNEPVRSGSDQSRLAAAKLALIRLLIGDETSNNTSNRLPNGTWVTLAYFYGDEQRKVVTTERLGRPGQFPVQLNSGNRKELAFLVEKMIASGESTPLAGAIQQVLLASNRDKFWPSRMQTTGTRTLIVVTDGIDNWGEFTNRKTLKTYPSVYRDAEGKTIQPGSLALEALLGTGKEDVKLHIVFFGMDDQEVTEAKGQFKDLTVESKFNVFMPPRTPARLLSERDAEGLKRYCYEALLPRFPYRLEGSTGNRDRLGPTLPVDDNLLPSPALPAGNYRLWDPNDLEAPQKLELRPGTRVMVQAKRARDGRFEFHLPPYAEKLSEKYQLPAAKIPKGLSVVVPDIKLGHPLEGTWMKLVACLERDGEQKATDLLDVTRPLNDFVWFEFTDPDGQPAPHLRIENRWHMWSPTWELTADRWDLAQRDRSSVRRPTLTAYWLGKQAPTPAGDFRVELPRVDTALPQLNQLYRVGQSEVKLLSVDVEEFHPDDSKLRGLPKGRFLTIRVQSTKPGAPTTPGERVFLMASGWNGIDQPWVLHQHHAYYDAYGRYTARLGPVLETMRPETVKFTFYALDSLKQASHEISLRLRPNEPLPDGKAMPKLTQEPNQP
jgi:hypothetical protein